jgi:hypothetical protein
LNGVGVPPPETEVEFADAGEAVVDYDDLQKVRLAVGKEEKFNSSHHTSGVACVGLVGKRRGGVITLHSTESRNGGCNQ